MRKMFHAGLVSLILGLLSGAAWAGTNTWDGNTDSNNGGNRSTADNWSPDTVPGEGDTAILPVVTSGARHVTVDVETVVGTLTWKPDGANEDYLDLQTNLTVGAFDADRISPVVAEEER